MKFSTRTMIREGMWTRLIRSLPIGVNEVGIINDRQYDILRVTIGRANASQNELTYSLATEDVFTKGKGKAIITVTRRE
jgi:hypothetical protein